MIKVSSGQPVAGLRVHDGQTLRVIREAWAHDGVSLHKVFGGTSEAWTGWARAIGTTGATT